MPRSNSRLNGNRKYSQTAWADNDPALGKQVLHIGSAQGKVVIGPDRIGDNLTRKTKPLQPG